MLAERDDYGCTYLRPGISPVRVPRATFFQKLAQAFRALRENLRRRVVTR